MSPKHRYAAVLRRAVGCGVVGGSAAALVAGLAGCAGGAGDPPASSTTSGSSGGATSSAPRSSPPSTTKTSATTTTTASAVQIPEAARAHTEAGAEAFVRFFLEQVNAAWTAPKTGLLLQLSDNGCLACKGFEDTASELSAKGERYDRTPASFTSITAVDGAPSGRQFVHVTGTQHRVNIVDRAGSVVKSDPEEKIAVNAMTVWRGDRWLLFDMG